MKYVALLLSILLLSLAAVAAEKPVPAPDKAVTLYFHGQEFCALAFSDLGPNPTGSVNLTYVDTSQPAVGGNFNIVKFAAVPFYTSCVGYPSCYANSPFWTFPNTNCLASPPPS